MRIFPSPVSAAAQTADGIAQTLPSPFSPANCHAVFTITPESMLELGPPSAARMGVTPPSAGSPQRSGHSSRGGCKPRPVVPQLGMQNRRAEAFPCRIIWRKGLTAPPVPGGKTLRRSLKTQGC